MKAKNSEQKKNTKAIEKLLFNFKDTETRIAAMEIEIEIITCDYDTLHGRSDNEIKASTPTNQVSSTVENNMIRKEEYIEKLKERIKLEQLNKRMIENALKSLNEYEMGLIAGRYFDGISATDLARKYNCVREYIYTQCYKIIDNKLSKYIHIFQGIM